MRLPWLRCRLHYEWQYDQAQVRCPHRPCPAVQEEEEPGVGPLQVRQGRQDDLLLLQQLGDHFVRLLPVALTVTSEEQKYILYFGRCTPTFTDSANSRPFYASFNDNFILLIYYKPILT